VTVVEGYSMGHTTRWIVVLTRSVRNTFDAWYKAVDFHVLEFKCVDVCKSGKVVVERPRHEPTTQTRTLIDSDLLHKGQQTQLVELG